MVELALDERGRFMRLAVTGEPTLERFAAYFQALVSHPDFHPGLNALWDFRQFKMASVPTATLRRLAGFLQENRDMRRGARVAVVVDSDADFGVARMFEAIATDVPSHFRVFRSVEQARDWLTAVQAEA